MLVLGSASPLARARIVSAQAKTQRPTSVAGVSPASQRPNATFRLGSTPTARSQAFDAAPRRCDVLSRSFSGLGDFGDPIQAEGVTPEDAQMLDEILAAGTFDDVRAKVREFAMDGSLSAGVLIAAEKVLEKTLTSSGGDKENVIYKSVEAVTALLRQTLDVVRHVAAKSALADVLLSVDSTTPAGAEQAVQLMREAFAATGPGAVERVEFIEDLVFFCQQQDAQDAELLKGVAEGTIDLGEYSLEDVMKGRREGAERMKRLVDLASGIAGGAPQV